MSFFGGRFEQPQSVTTPSASIFTPLGGKPTTSQTSGFSVDQHQTTSSRTFANEDQRKDMQVLELRKQVSELLRYREQCSNLRAQLALIEEREKLREAELTTKNNELLERVRSLEDVENSLRTQIIRLDEEKLELTRKSSLQVGDLQAQLASFKADSERREIVKSKLEQEMISNTTRNYIEREHTQIAFIGQLQEQVNALTSNKQELEAEIHNLQSRLQIEKEDQITKKFKRDQKIKSLQDEVGSVRTTLEETRNIHDKAMENTELQHERMVALLKDEISNLKTALADAQDEVHAQRISQLSLEQEAGLVQALRAEITSLRNTLNDTQELLRFEKLNSQGKIVSESAFVSLLQSEISSLKDQLRFLKSTESEANLVTVLKSEVSSLKDQLLRISKSNEIEPAYISSLKTENTSLKEQLRIARFNEPEAGLVTVLRTEISSLKSNLNDAFEQIRTEKSNAKLLEKEVVVISLLRSEISSLKSSLSSMQEQLRNKISEHESTIVTFKNEISSVKSVLSLTQDLLNEERANIKNIEQEKKTALGIVNELEAQLRDQRSKTQDYANLTMELHEKSQKCESLQREIEKVKETEELFREELSKSKSTIRELENRVEIVAFEIVNVLGTATQAIQTTISSIINLTNPNINIPEIRFSVSGFQTVEAQLRGLQNKVIDLVLENKGLKTQVTKMRKEWEDYFNSKSLEIETKEFERKKAMDALITICKEGSSLCRSFEDKSAMEIETSQNVSVDELFDSWKNFKNFLSDKLLSLSQSKLKLQQDIENQQQNYEERISSLETSLKQAMEGVGVGVQALEETNKARYEAEVLFYSIGLLVRAIRPLRARLTELVAQKRLLKNRLRECENIKEGVVILAHAVTGHSSDPSDVVWKDYQHGIHPRKKTAFRVAGLVVIAFNRLRWGKVRSTNGTSRYSLGNDQRGMGQFVGTLVKLGRERLSLAPSNVISNIKTIPHLSLPPFDPQNFQDASLSLSSMTTPQEDVQNIFSLLNHFDPPNMLEDQLLSPHFLLSLAHGYKNNIRFRMQRGQNVEKEIFPEDGLIIVRKTLLEIMRRLKDLQDQSNEISRLQGVERALQQSEEMVAILQSRLAHVQEEDLQSQIVVNQELRKSLAEARQQLNDEAGYKQDILMKENLWRGKEEDVLSREININAKEENLNRREENMRSREIEVRLRENEIKQRENILQDDNRIGENIKQLQRYAQSLASQLSHTTQRAINAEDWSKELDAKLKKVLEELKIKDIEISTLSSANQKTVEKTNTLLHQIEAYKNVVSQLKDELNHNIAWKSGPNSNNNNNNNNNTLPDTFSIPNLTNKTTYRSRSPSPIRSQTQQNHTSFSNNSNNNTHTTTSNLNHYNSDNNNNNTSSNNSVPVYYHSPPRAPVSSSFINSAKKLHDSISRTLDSYEHQY